MALLQYCCPNCGEKFEELVKSPLDAVLCPKCKAEARRCYSGQVFSSTGKPVKKCSGNCKNCSGCN